ncbi:hypothetical protein QTP70_021343 [Hemibagrus guttatus]|uniref:Uncharacterized protein n=1 Tax=Hemibagrus guttatus TaxID=175788 RepID=A0AAE0PZ17_9TELE|nr:hypothetical protein QTP70_021343 [Hemibagrus guttatus]
MRSFLLPDSVFYLLNKVQLTTWKKKIKMVNKTELKRQKFVGMVCAEFRRITGVDLKIAFMSSLNKHSNNLIKIYRAKTKDLADEMKLILDSFDEQDTDEEEAYVRGVKLCILEVMEDDISTSEKPTCVNRGIIVEGTLVMEDIPDFPTAFMVLFGLLYALKISYPKGLKYTFEAVQDIFVGLGEKCTNKVQSLKNKLFKV